MANERPRLREARQAAGLSQYDLAARIGLPRPNITRWESGEVMPKVDSALRIAQLLDTTVEAIWDAKPAKK